ncbi:zona pellucida-binding protein 2 [Cygnus olor]|uniref:zona pellucida-binding protein 2 n=1 Tax=Cygnus olor TaxID=8869 RepID=UPI001ADE81A1|nr:zona pellucida-binding protein 2 [Cygnus olor]
MAGGGKRPCSPPRVLLGMVAVVVAAAGWGALAGASAVPEEELRSVGLIQNNYIYADIKREVKVYVKVFTNSPFLVCMDLSLSQEEIIDPKYLWIGPDGKNLEGQIYANLTETGKLMLMGFKESMSGAYTCTLSHRIIETMTQEEVDVFETYKFMLYAYREADHAYQISVRFTTKGCELAANAQFFEELKKILDNIISDLTCHIIESSYKCHSIRIPNQGLLHELFVTFQVNPFAPGWEEVCQQVPYDCEDATNMKVQEARDRIGEFFSRQTYALKHEFQTAPTIHYVDNSFSVTHVDSCQPGFGKNDITHQNCAGCCVVCEPGTYSPNNEVTCHICTRPHIKKYGARFC